MTHVYQEVEKKTRQEDRSGAQIHVQPEDQEVFRVLRFLCSRSGQLAQGPVGTGRVPQRPGHLRRPAQGRKGNQRQVRQSLRIWAFTGARYQHGDARLLWSFGGAEQDEAGNVTINSKNTIEALKFMKALYEESETPEVFTWTPPSNNQAMLAGKVSYVANAISITRQAEREKLPIDKNIMISPAH